MPAIQPVLIPSTLKIANELLAWCTEFLANKESGIKRPHGGQTVCPFIAPSIENNSFYLAFQDEITGKHEDKIIECVTAYINDFNSLFPQRLEDRNLKALLIIFPDIPRENAGVLSRVATAAKTSFVKEGLMLAPFYPGCRDTSVHNKDFETSDAPHPCIAIRHMAIHDILFLAARVEWFEPYNRRFGHFFKESGKLLDESNKYLLPHFIAARDSFPR